jgi:S1-C subfamily serine protease
MKRQVLYSASRRSLGAGEGTGHPGQADDPDRPAYPDQPDHPVRGLAASSPSLSEGETEGEGSPRTTGGKTERSSRTTRGETTPSPPLSRRGGAERRGGGVSRWPRWRAFAARHADLLRFLAGAVCVALVGTLYLWQQPRPVPLRQEDIDAAVLHTLENRMLPERAAKAADTVRPSLVRVRGFADVAKAKSKDKPRAQARKMDPGKAGKGAAKDDGVPAGMEPISLGTGVVIVDDGTILTNLHVVYGAKHVSVAFHDGSESPAELVSVHPENDLAVIKAKKIPDDLPAATLGSAARLKPGDEVVAVGFPFGMGPSVSFGVISGLNREFRSPEGERVLTRLIQFDAAANPGSSGGPLVTMQGDVVGIVTAILNPTEAGTFIGIGFAVTIGVAGRAAGMHPF